MIRRQQKRTKIRKTILTFVIGGCFGSILTVFLTEYFNLLHSINDKNKSNISNNNDALIEEEAHREKKQLSQDKNEKGWKNIHIFYGDAEEGLGIKNAEQKYFGQVNQDEIVLDLIGPNGYFIDLAANDAVDFSNTLSLERSGWDGLCIEPNPTYWYGLSHRKCTVVGALVGGNNANTHDELTKVQVKFRGVFGGIVGKMDEKLANRKREPDTITENRYLAPLTDIFELYNVPKTIDYVNLDVEGAEYIIMEHFPFTKYTIRIMTVERPSKELKSLLEKNGYMFVKEVSWWGETLWAHESMGLHPDHPKVKNMKTDHKKN